MTARKVLLIAGGTVGGILLLMVLIFVAGQVPSPPADVSARHHRAGLDGTGT